MKFDSTATIASKVYGYILAHPGSTTREIRVGLGYDRMNPAVNSAITAMMRRNALIGINADGGRNTRYYKGTAPVVLHQAHGFTNDNLNSEIKLVKAKQELVRDIRLLMAQLESMTA
jgi:hypothetical protein